MQKRHGIPQAGIQADKGIIINHIQTIFAQITEFLCIGCGFFVIFCDFCRSNDSLENAPPDYYVYRRVGMQEKMLRF